MKTTLKINRKGTFNTTPDQATEHQCVAKEHRSYAFDCQVQLLDPTLDQRGFIADHEEINTVIQNVAKGRIPSCELLAKALAEGVSKFLITREIHHEYVYIKLKADNHVALAWMEAWARPEEEDFMRSSTTAQASQPAKKYQVLSIDEIRKLKGVYENTPDHLYHHEHSGILVGDDIRALSKRILLSEKAAEEYKKQRADNRAYTTVWIGDVKYDIPLWAIVEATPEPAEVPKQKLYRIKTAAEFDADPSVKRTDKGWLHKDGRHFNITQSWRMDTYHGLVLTEEQSRTLVNGGTFYLGSDWSEPGPGGTIAPWMVTPVETPIPEVTTPVAKATWRFKTEAEFKADPDVRAESQGYFTYVGSAEHTEKAFISGMAIAFGKPVPETALKTLLKNRATIIRNVEIDPVLDNGGGWNYAKWMITDAPLPEAKKVWRIKTWDEMAAEYSIDGDGNIDLPSTYFTPAMKHLCGVIVPESYVQPLLDSEYVKIADAQFGVKGDWTWIITKEVITDKPMPVVEAPKPVWRILTKAEVEAKHMSSGQLLKLKDINQYGRILTDEEYKAITTGLSSQYDGHTFCRGLSWAKSYGIASYDITSDPLPEKKYRIRKYEDLEADTATYYKDKRGDLWTIDRRIGSTSYDHSMKDLGGQELTPAQVNEIKAEKSTNVEDRYEVPYMIEEWMIEEYTG